MTGLAERNEKLRRARELMDRLGLDAIALSTTANFAWLTRGGSNYVGTATEIGVATAVITRSAEFIVCDNIEADRLWDEEVAGQGFEFRPCRWYEDRKADLVREIAGGGALGSDTPMEDARHVSAEFDPLRYSLTSEEIERYRLLGKMTGECLEATANTIEPGMTEYEIAAILDHHVVACGAVPTVTLIATDERIVKYRHPLPSEKKLERVAMLIIGARKWGLIVSATRVVHFGPLPPELRRKHDAVCAVDAAFISATRPGAGIGCIFKKALQVYAENGFGAEWLLHHQGGPTGYKAREFRAHSGTMEEVVENQAFAWNPSITGTKSEDTIIATPAGPEIISSIDGWPTVEVDTLYGPLRRPDILVR